MRMSYRMRTLEARLRRQGWRGLADYVLDQVNRQRLTVAAVADQLSVEASTLYRWLPKLGLELDEVPRLLDRRTPADLAEAEAGRLRAAERAAEPADG